MQPDGFTRMRPEIYGCVSMCMGVSVFRRDAMRVSVQACLCKKYSQDTERVSK